MTNGAPRKPETIEGLIMTEKTEVQMGPAKGRATRILVAAENMDNELRIAEEFLGDTDAAERGILAILQEEFDVNEEDLQTRRTQKNQDLHQELADHTYRAYHEFLFSIATIIGKLQGEKIDTKAIYAAIIQYYEKEEQLGSVYQWLTKNPHAKEAIKDMVENGISGANKAHLVGAIQRATTEGVKPLRTFTEDKIMPLLRTVELLREMRNGTPQDIQERLLQELKDVPPRGKVLAIFNDYKELIGLEGKERGLEIRINGKRMELQPSDLENENTETMQGIAALYATGARIVFVAYLTKESAK